MRRHYASWMLALVWPLHAAWSHEQWIEADRMFVASGQTLRVTIGGGHAYPHSEFAVKPDVLRAVEFRCGAGAPAAVAVQRGETSWQGEMVVEGEGPMQLCAVFQRPRATAPDFEARALILRRPGADDPARYRTGVGLEVVPERAVSAVRPGEELGFRVWLDGVPVTASIEVMPADGKPMYLKSTDQAPGMFRVARAGRYLAVARHEGRSCSLAFEVQEPAEPGT